MSYPRGNNMYQEDYDVPAKHEVRRPIQAATAPPSASYTPTRWATPRYAARTNQPGSSQGPWVPMQPIGYQRWNQPQEGFVVSHQPPPVHYMAVVHQQPYAHPPNQRKQSKDSRTSGVTVFSPPFMLRMCGGFYTWQLFIMWMAVTGLFTFMLAFMGFRNHFLDMAPTAAGLNAPCDSNVKCDTAQRLQCLNGTCHCQQGYQAVNLSCQPVKNHPNGTIPNLTTVSTTTATQGYLNDTVSNMTTDLTANTTESDSNSTVFNMSTVLTASTTQSSGEHTNPNVTIFLLLDENDPDHRFHFGPPHDEEDGSLRSGDQTFVSS